MANLVFIGHEASQSGAPYTQLYLLQWLRANTDHIVELVLLRGGPLLAEFQKVANVHVVYKYGGNPSLGQRVLRKTEAITNFGLRQIFRKLAQARPRLIFANTAPALEFAVRVKRALGVPLLINVHELASTFFYTDAALFAHNAAEIDVFIPGSLAVNEFYKTFCAIPEARTQVVYDFTGQAPGGGTTSAAVRQELGIPADARIVGGIGAFNWRKAPDLFLQAAQQCQQHSADEVHFIWVGGDVNTQAYKELTYDVQALGLTGRMHLVGSKTALRGYYESFDVFLLTSREDPFPLVCLEAALQGCPIICFAQAGGMPEFVLTDAGYVVPYADAAAMGRQAAHLLAHEPERRQMGAVAQLRARQEHTIGTIGPQMYAAMQPFL